MNKRLAGVLFFAFVVAAGASYALYWFIGARLAETQQEPSGQIIVAARTLEIGTMIQDLDLKTTEWAGTVPASAITETENARQQSRQQRRSRPPRRVPELLSRGEA